MRRGKWIVRVSVGALLASLLWTPARNATADEVHCSRGDARAVWEAFATKLFVEGDYPPCQYRLFWGGQHVTFHEDDWFVGGNSLFIAYDQEGLTREQAIAELERLSGRLWLSMIDPNGKVGPAVEQTLMETTYKDMVLPGFGLIVFRHVGVILHLPPGDYLSTWHLLQDGRVIDRARVTVHVLPT